MIRDVSQAQEFADLLKPYSWWRSGGLFFFKIGLTVVLRKEILK